MAGNLVAEIKVGKDDLNGNKIDVVYGAVSTLYAVYRAGHHVFVQFADDNTQGANQRAALRPLAILRSEVESSVARLRARGETGLFRTQRTRARAERKASESEWRLARILLTALQGDDQGALGQLTAMRDDLNEDHASEIRSWHLVYAAFATLGAILLSWGLASTWCKEHFHDFGAYTPDYWNAGAIGAIGALFSIALQLRARAMPVDMQFWDNFCDAILRIFIGAVSGTILYALFFGGLVSIQIGGAAVDLANDEVVKLAWQVVLPFIAGFTERLVADFVSGIALAKASTPPATPAAAPANPDKTEHNIAQGNTPPNVAAPATPKLPAPPAHDPSVPNRFEADDIADVAKIIGGKLDPMEGQV